MREATNQVLRISIPYFEGINSSVQHMIARRTEMAHMENARAPIIGVLEKREGQKVLGTKSDGTEFITKGNFGLEFFSSDLGDRLYRVSTEDGSLSNLYYLDDDDYWQSLTDTNAQGLSLAQCDFANVDGQLVIVNGADENRLITSDGLTISTGIMAGSLFNSPIANKVAFYKNRIYLGDFIDPVSNVRYKTTILRSSYSLGIIALANDDVSAAENGNWHIPVTDSKYFYTDTGMNMYQVYRGGTKVATMTLSSFTETEIVVTDALMNFETGFSTILSSDEIWVYGTYTGEKQYRWINNPSSIGRDVKQYDTFKLAGGSEDSLTMLEPIGNILMIANKNSMMTWNDYNLESFDVGIGCSAKNGYVKLHGAIYFIHSTGIYSTTGSTPQLISRKIERYIKGATKAGIEASAAGYKGLSVFFTIGDSTLYNPDGSVWKTLNDCCLEFNVADQNWYVHTNVSATEFKTFLSTTGQERLSMCSLTESQPAIYGPELIANGHFTDNADKWTLGEGWTYGTNNVGYSNL